MDHSNKISVKRNHGIGNIILLLPVLDRYVELGYEVELITKSEYISVFSYLRPDFEFKIKPSKETIDLDSITKGITPAEHRSNEFGHILGMSPPFRAPRISPNKLWTQSFKKYKKYNTIIFATEAGHPARTWPITQAIKTCEVLMKKYNLILVGINTSSAIPCHEDLRGKLTLQELIGLLSIGKTTVSMDSGSLHLSTAIGLPTVALFGGISPEYRIHKELKCIVLQSKLSCCPCNKLESCNGAYDCLNNINPVHILKAVDMVAKIKTRTIWKI